MRELRGKVALVTGAAGGIGRATSLALARQGCRLIVCDVDVGGLAAVAAELNGVSQCLCAEVTDVADREAMAALAARVHQLVPAVDVLVNNAGVGLAGGIDKISLDDWEWILGVNLRGVIHGCHFFIPRMMECGAGGHVVNLSSLLGIVGAPDAAAYATTKFAVFGLSESLRAELAPHGIGVSTICPGIINTNIIAASRLRGDGDPEATRARVVELYRRRNYGPEKVAAAILQAVRHNRAVVPVSPESWLSYYLKRLAPAAAINVNALVTRRQLAAKR